jgi:Uma2 family endonuclease
MAVTNSSIGALNEYQLAVDFRSIQLKDEQFYRLCRDNPELRMELTAEGGLVVMSPSGAKTSWRNSKLTQRLANWADGDGRGVAFDSNAGFTLPNGAKRSPDAAWVHLEAWQGLTEEEQERFAPLCPDFVAELRSPRDSLSSLHEKMQEYLDNGARLGWLLDPVEKRVYVYRPGRPVECLENPVSLSGENVLEGFTLDLRDIL